MVPPVHVDAPDTTTSDDPPNMPLVRSNVLAVAPVLLKTAVPPLIVRELPPAIVAVLVNVVVPLAKVML